jgi:hypothetical protein
MRTQGFLLSWYLLRYFGPRWLCFRAWYAARQRSGWFQRQLPLSSWEAQPFQQFVADSILGNPEAYLCYRRKNGSAFLFAPEQRLMFMPYLTAWDEPEAHQISA